jgi:Ran GTPase-activating protein (RanGAP) involved in mRNA processing and transport
MAAQSELPEQVFSITLTSANITQVLEEDLPHFHQLRYLDLADNKYAPSLSRTLMRASSLHSTWSALHRFFC